MKFPKRDTIINGAAFGLGAYVIGVFIKDTRQVRQQGKSDRAKIRKEGAIDIEAILYASEEVSRRNKAGEYQGEDIAKFLTDIRFFQFVKAEELRERYKEV